MLSDPRRIRNSYLRFPRWTQHFITWLTGLAYPNQKPLYTPNPWQIFFQLILLFGAALTASIFILHTQGRPYLYLWLLPTWILTTAGARALVLTVRHECAHFNFSGSRFWDKVVIELITTMVCSRNGANYRVYHVTEHHSRSNLLTESDPHIMTLRKYGFQPGMSKSALWSHLLVTLLSPRFHAKQIKFRIIQNFIDASAVRIVASTLFLALWTTLIVFTKLTFFDFLLAYFVPTFLFFNMCFLLEILVEHPWSESVAKPDCDLSRKCWVVFNGSALPKSQGVVSWSIWGIEMLGHFFAKILVLPGPLCAHDLHHRKPNQYNWRIAAYERSRLVLEQNDDSYHEVQGFIGALDSVFQGLSEAQEISLDSYVRA